MASIRVITDFAGAVRAFYFELLQELLSGISNILLRILHDHSWESPPTGNLFLFCWVSELFWHFMIVLHETHVEPPFHSACNPLPVTVIDDLSSSRKRELSIEPDLG